MLAEIKPVWQEGTYLNEEQESLERQAKVRPYRSLQATARS